MNKTQCVLITMEGRLNYDIYKPYCIERVVLEVLMRGNCSMFDLVDRVRHHTDSLRFIQPQRIATAVVELQQHGYVRNTYGD